MPCGVGGRTHRSWPGGREGRPRALILGERVGLAGQGWWVITGAGLVDGGSGRRGKGSGKGCKGFGSGGVSGRDTAPGTEQISSFLTRTKRRKMKGSGKGWGCKGFGSGQVVGRGTGSRDGANSAMFTVPCDALNTA